MRVQKYFYKIFLFFSLAQYYIESLETITHVSFSTNIQEYSKNTFCKIQTLFLTVVKIKIELDTYSQQHNISLSLIHNLIL